MSVNVLHIVLNEFVHDTRVLKECRSLVKFGYSVSVICLHRKGLRKNEDRDGIMIKRLKLHSRGLPVILKRHIFIKIFGYLEFFLIFFIHSLRSKRFTVAHCHDLQALPLGVILKLIGKVKKCVYDMHELETERNSIKQGSIWQSLAKFLERSLLFFSDALITVSESIALHYQTKYGCEKPRLILNCPPYQNTSQKDILRRMLGISKTTRIVIYQGKLTIGRSIPAMLEIFESMQMPDLALVIMGTGKLEEEVKRRVKKHDNGIYFVPAVLPDDVLDITSSADIGLALIENTCLSYFFSLPNKVFEFLMAGLAIIVSDFPELKKIVQNHGVGEAVDVDDLSQIRRALERMATVDLGHYRHSAKKASRNFCWEKQEVVLSDIYRQLVKDM